MLLLFAPCLERILRVFLLFIPAFLHSLFAPEREERERLEQEQREEEEREYQERLRKLEEQERKQRARQQEIEERERRREEERRAEEKVKVKICFFLNFHSFDFYPPRDGSLMQMILLLLNNWSATKCYIPICSNQNILSIQDWGDRDEGGWRRRVEGGDSERRRPAPERFVISLIFTVNTFTPQMHLPTRSVFV